MDSSTTENTVETNGLEDQTTEQVQQEVTAETVHEEAASNEAVESTSTTATDEPKQTETKGDEVDEAFLRFAKSQNVDDISTLTDKEKRFLKIAYDNKKSYTEAKNSTKLSNVTRQISGDDSDINARIDQLEYREQLNEFWANHDRELESTMIEVLEEKISELTPRLGEQKAREYAYTLSRDLPTLYDIAQVRVGKNTVDVEAIRKQERQSIAQKESGSVPTPAAVDVSPKAFDVESFVENEYDPKNPKHKELLREHGYSV